MVLIGHAKFKVRAFLGCAGHPKCDFIRPLAHHDSQQIEVLEDSACPECGKPLVIKIAAMACLLVAQNPDCHYIAHDEEPSNTEVLLAAQNAKKASWFPVAINLVKHSTHATVILVANIPLITNLCLKFVPCL